MRPICLNKTIKLRLLALRYLHRVNAHECWFCQIPKVISSFIKSFLLRSVVMMGIINPFYKDVLRKTRGCYLMTAYITLKLFVLCVGLRMVVISL